MVQQEAGSPESEAGGSGERLGTGRGFVTAQVSVPTVGTCSTPSHLELWHLWPIPEFEQVAPEVTGAPYYQLLSDLGQSRSAPLAFITNTSGSQF